ncbi:MAG TPA: hypothetical protein VFH70_05870 [Acidimicrobiales bacterium]|nr:hypothetical protein [Acidimicrobiales bacterium]
MLPGWLVIVGVLIGSLGTVRYVGDTVRGVTVPHRVTWFLWAAAPLLAYAVEVSNHVGISSLMALEIGLGPVVVFLASFVHPRASWKADGFDYVCGGLSVGGTALWLATRQGWIGIGAAIAADLLASIPTFRKSWHHPGSETARTFVLSAVNSGLTLLTISRWTVDAAAFPAYIFAFNVGFVTLVLGRRRLVGSVHPSETLRSEAGNNPRLR